MAKIDFKKELSELYQPSGKTFSLVEVPHLPFLMIDGHGDPNTSADYAAAVEALYAVAYAAKFLLKKRAEAGDPDYVVAPLEGLWWVEDMREFSIDDKGNWDWTMMILQPAWITPEIIESAKAQVVAKKGLAAADKLRLETYHEGMSIQILYTGPYAGEGPIIAAMHAHAQEQGYVLAGKHHEIYLSDPRRVAPEKLKTVIRQPLRRGDQGLEEHHPA